MDEELIIPEEFSKIIVDFVNDIKNTFPEVEKLIEKWWKPIESFEHITNIDERQEAIKKSHKDSIQLLFKFCQKKYPPHFFEILYQNNDIFNQDSDIDTEFLPHIHFKNLWNFDITDKTRETIWKYLQLILFSTVSSVNDKEAFGDSAKLFEAINEEDFKTKLEETMSQMQGLFDISDNELPNGTTPNFDMDNMPNPEQIHEHISGMLGGKLGQLAKEIAEETAANLNMDMDNTTDMKDVFNKLIKNPTKLMGLVKTVTDKLDSRIKSGEIKESEIMSEASDILNKMKNMPGMGNIQQMLGKMGMSGLGGKVNMGAMEAQLNRNMKAAQTKERIRAKAEAIRIAKEKSSQNNNLNTKNDISDEQIDKIVSIFSTGENVEKTPRGAKPQQQASTKSKNKKNKK
jgi:hypothetical protein